MNTTEFSRQWPRMKETIQKDFPEIPEEDLTYELGKELELLKKLQERTGKTKEEIFNWLHIMG